MKRIIDYIENIKELDLASSKKAEERQNILTKPTGSLGILEKLSIDIAGMTRNPQPRFARKTIFTLAGDHGICEEGVSAYPQEVTPQMMYNFIEKGAAVNVFAKKAGADVFIADLGVVIDLDIDSEIYRNKKVAYGTKNFAKEAAMTKEQAITSILNGIELFEEENKKQKIDLVGIGEMGIGNTTPATAILSVISGKKVSEITGRGTGIDDKGLQNKIRAIEKGIKLNNPDKNDGIDILQKVGGFEIGGMAGIILAAAKNNTPVIIDGLISTSAALIAALIAPISKKYMIASHLSDECGHKYMLEILGKEPILKFGLRLGEGTGAALAMNIVESAVNILSEMATFESAGVSDK